MSSNRQRSTTQDFITKLDCCGLFAAINYLITPDNRIRSFAERNYDVNNLSSDKDSAIAQLLKKANFTQCKFAVYNPPLAQEVATFSAFTMREKANMLQRNSHLLSRLFVKNAEIQGLGASFLDKTTIRVLDLGCGNALSLPGVFAYFGENKIEYVGVDVDRTNIQECRSVYQNFSRVEFLCQDGVKFLETAANHEKFDVILFQHPNLSSPLPEVINAFRNMFIKASQALTPGGVIYCTFYYEQEKNYFTKMIQPHLPEFFKASNFSGMNQYVNQLAMMGPQGAHIFYSPENFAFMSMPKPRLELENKKRV